MGTGPTEASVALGKGMARTLGAGTGVNQVFPFVGSCRNTSRRIGSVGLASKGFLKRATSGPKQAALEAEEEKNRTPRINK